MKHAKFKIRTRVDEEALRRLVPEPAPGTDVPKYWAQNRRRAALNPAMSIIEQIDFVSDCGTAHVISHPDEATVLKTFWEVFREIDVWHYESLHGGVFDPRFLVVRSWVRKVPVPRAAYDKGPGWSLNPERWVNDFDDPVRLREEVRRLTELAAEQAEQLRDCAGPV